VDTFLLFLTGDAALARKVPRVFLLESAGLDADNSLICCLINVPLLGAPCDESLLWPAFPFPTPWMHTLSRGPHYALPPPLPWVHPLGPEMQQFPLPGGRNGSFFFLSTPEPPPFCYTGLRLRDSSVRDNARTGRSA